MTGNAVPGIDYDVIYDGVTQHLDNANLLNQGGEAIIFEGKDGKRKPVALKVIHPVMRNDERFRKLQAQIKRLPPVPKRTIGPEKAIYDVTGNQIIGFGMKLIDIDKYDQLIWWTQQEYRLTNQIDVKDISLVFYELRQEVDAASKAGYVYADFNPKGILVLRKEYWDDTNINDRIRIVDADAAIFDGYKCQVYTLDYLDPRLMQDVIQKIGYVNYDKGSDVFAYTAMFLQVLTTIGVWHGHHPLWKSNANALARRNLHVLHKEIEYPKNGVPFDKLPQPYQTFIKSVIVDGKRDLISESVFTSFLGIQGQNYALYTRQSTPTVSNAEAQVKELLKDLGLIVDFFVSGDLIHILCIDTNGEYRYVTSFNNTITDQKIPGALKGSNYRILDDGILSEISKKPSKVSTAPFRTYDMKYKRWREHMGAVSVNKTPIIGGGNGNIYSGSNGFIMVQKYRNTSSLEFGHSIGVASDMISDAMSGNHAGYIKNYNSYSWFFYRNGNSYDIPISPLRDTEFMTKFDILWGINSAVLVRLTEYQGTNWTRLDEVDLSSRTNGSRIIGSPRMVDEQLFWPLNGAAYIRDTDTSYIIYATNNGVTRENLTNGDIDIFTKTKSLVDKGMSLRLYKAGILAIGNGKVLYITL